MKVIRQIVRSSVRFLGQFQSTLQRGVVLFVGIVLATSICLPPAAALATTIASAAPAATQGQRTNHTVTDPHAKAAHPNFTAANQNLGNAPAPQTPQGIPSNAAKRLR